MPPSSPRPRAARLGVLLASTLAVTLAAPAVHGRASAVQPAAAVAVSQQRAKPITVKVDPRLFGVHDYNLNSLSRRGTGSIRLWDAGTTWADMQPTDAMAPDFTRLDEVVAKAWANHTEVTLVTAMTPPWAGLDPYVTALRTDMPDPAKYQTYLAAVLARYQNYLGSGRPGIANLQVWNEANVSASWTGTTAQMATLVKAAYDVRNQTDPQVKLIAPALVARLGYQRTWLKAFYAEKVSGQPVWKYVDAISFNLYPLDRYPSGSGTRPSTPEDSIALLAAARVLLAKDKVPSTIPIWDSEVNYGLTSGSNGGYAATPISTDLQVANVIRTYLLNAAQGVRRVHWYAYDMGNLPDVRGGGPLGNTLLTDPDDRAAGILTPAGLAFRRVQQWMAGTLVGTATKRPCIADRNGTYTCLIRYAKGVGRVYWNPYRTAKVTLATSATKKIDEYGVSRTAKGGSRLKVGAKPVLVKSRK
jgi:polysaccharide biosynthesis protein PslG